MQRAMSTAAAAALLLVLPATAHAVPGPDSVAVLANADVPGSVALAERYARERAIPDRQVCALSMPATEDVSLADFEAMIRAPLAGRWAEVPGVTSSATVALQVRASWLTFRVALDGRLDGPSTDAGRAIPGSEHAVLFVSPDVLLAPIADLIFVIGLRMPAASYAPDGRMEGPYVHAGVVGDL